MIKKNYIVTANVDGNKKNFSMHNVTEKQKEKIAINIAKSLFCASCIFIIEYVKY